MPRIAGKTINELLRVSDITGSEIIPMSVYNAETSAYVTRGITLDNFFKTIYNKLQETDTKLQDTDNRLQETTYNLSYVSDRVVELHNVDKELQKRDDDLDSQIAYTNAYVSYNAEGIVKLHNDIHNLASYTYMNTGNVTNILDSYSYAIAYNALVNKTQSGRINTLYYENSNDAFDDWSNPDDDYVTPQD